MKTTYLMAYAMALARRKQDFESLNAIIRNIESGAGAVELRSLN